MSASHKRQLRNYLLDPKYQLRYTLIMVLLSSLLTAGLGYVWYEQMRVASKVIEVRDMATMNDEEVQQIQEQIASQDRMRLLVLVGFGVLFAFVLAGYGIMLTHKVAGPLFKISRYMASVKDGKLGPIYDLRKGDHLQDFFEGFKQMHGALRQQQEADATALGEVIACTERFVAQAGPQASAEMTRHLESLRAMRDRKTASLTASS